MLREKTKAISMISMLLRGSHAGPRRHTGAGSHQELTPSITAGCWHNFIMGAEVCRLVGKLLCHLP